MIWQPGEISRDEIYGNPDGYATVQTVADPFEVYAQETPQIEIQEFKATWKSRHGHGDVVAEKIWMWQLLGYCAMTGYRRARLWVFWVNGDYRQPSPALWVYVLEFSDEEVEQFWSNVVLANKDKVEGEKARA
jgi:hypothetical protein